MTSHAEARRYAEAAILCHFGEPATSGETRSLAGIACLETHYGDSWKGPGRGSNNLGAEQCGPSWTGDRFVYVDTHPNADGTSTPYRAEFRKYPSPRAGWDALVPIVFENRKRSIVRDAAKADDLQGVSRGLYQTGYYEGFGQTPSARIAFHYRALSRCVADADKAVAPRVAIHELPPTLRRGARDTVKHGPVWLLQVELKLAGDGAFGPITEDALNAYKRAVSLPADGICDARTWEALLSDDYLPEAA